MKLLQTFTHDGFPFRQHEDGSWEVYWNEFIALGTGTAEDVKARWPGDKAQIIKDRLGQ